MPHAHTYNDPHTHQDTSSSSFWIFALVLLALVLLYLYFGTNLFRGFNVPIPAPQSQQGGNSQGGDVNIKTPDRIDVNLPQK